MRQNLNAAWAAVFAGMAAICTLGPAPACAQGVQAAMPSGAAVGQSVEVAMAAQLRAEGYVNVQVSRTWLGRIRVLGWLDGRMREIIIHPTSGEVLRDYIEPPALYASALDHDPSGASTSAASSATIAATGGDAGTSAALSSTTDTTADTATDGVGLQ